MADRASLSQQHSQLNLANIHMNTLADQPHQPQPKSQSSRRSKPKAIKYSQFQMHQPKQVPKRAFHCNLAIEVTQPKKQKVIEAPYDSESNEELAKLNRNKLKIEELIEAQWKRIDNLRQHLRNSKFAQIEVDKLLSHKLTEENRKKLTNDFNELNEEIKYLEAKKAKSQAKIVKLNLKLQEFEQLIEDAGQVEAPNNKVEVPKEEKQPRSQKK